MMKSEDYWDRKIIEWEDSMKGGGKTSFIEKLASRFRKPLVYRAEFCQKILQPFVKNKSVLELGCGSGFFAFELYERGKPASILGIDISENAIKRATKIRKDKNYSEKIRFQKADVTSASLPKADIIVGLGFLDYLSPEEIKSLFESLKGKYFLFTFSEKKFSLLRYMHILYLRSQKCPKHYYYTKEQIRDYIGGIPEIKFFNHKKIAFGCIVHNLLAENPSA